VGNGTTQVADIDEIDGSNPQNLTVFNGELYFTAEDRFHGTELWKTDGTGGVGNGTIQVADINKINGSTQEVDLHKNQGSSPTSLTVFDGQLFLRRRMVLVVLSYGRQMGRAVSVMAQLKLPILTRAEVPIRENSRF